MEFQHPNTDRSVSSSSSSSVPLLQKEIGRQVMYERQWSSQKGRHIVATTKISCGTIVFEERPLLSHQSVGNAHAGALVCRNCRAFVGGPHLSLAVASGRISREHLFQTDNEEGEFLVSCRQECGELYCGATCEEHMWTSRGHGLLCTGHIDDDESTLHPIIQFKVHALQNNEILLLVAELIATVISLRSQHLASSSSSPPIQRIVEPYLDFTSVPWWEVATVPLLSSPTGIMEASQLDMALRRMCRESALLLKAALLSNGSQKYVPRAIDECEREYEIFSELFFGRVIGSFERNAIGIRARHPLCRDILMNRELRRRHGDLTRCLEAAGMIGDADNNDNNNDDDVVVVEHTDTSICLSRKENCDSLIGTDEESVIEEEKRGVDCDYTTNELSAFLSRLHMDETNHGLSRCIERTENDVQSCAWEEDGGDDLDVLFSPLDGTAMYSIACKMNHSCDPNVVVRYTHSFRSTGGMWGADHPLLLQCVAVRDIEKGEELCISYIRSDASFARRQEELKHYGFECQCVKCELESHHDEITTTTTTTRDDNKESRKEENVDSAELQPGFGTKQRDTNCSEWNDFHGYDDESRMLSEKVNIYESDDERDGEMLLQRRVAELDRILANGH